MIFDAEWFVSHCAPFCLPQHPKRFLPCASIQKRNGCISFHHRMVPYEHQGIPDRSEIVV
jgi:hypothetical protein